MGINWENPQVITNTSKVFAAFSMVLLGVASWDVLSTLWFEWQIITGKRKWRWPMVIYFVARIAMMLHILAISINRNALSPVPCTELTFMSKFCDALGTCMSSLILCLRTRAVWHRDKRVSAVLALLFIGQAVIWGQTFRYSKAAWNDKRKLCDVLSTAPRSLMITVWCYTMVFDLIILLLCTFRLVTFRTTTLGHILLRDGIAYFAAAFGANLVQTIFAGLQLNPVMNIMALPFAVVVSVIAATTVFRNVFTAYDGFSGDLNGANDTSKTGNSGVHTGARIVFNRHTTTHPATTTASASANEYPLGDYKNARPGDTIGALSVHKVVEVEDPSESQRHERKSRGQDGDEDSFIFPEKPSHL